MRSLSLESLIHLTVAISLHVVPAKAGFSIALSSRHKSISEAISDVESGNLEKREPPPEDYPDRPLLSGYHNWFAPVEIGTPPLSFALSISQKPLTWVAWLPGYNTTAETCLVTFEDNEYYQCETSDYSGSYDPNESRTYQNISDQVPEFYIYNSEVSTEGYYGSDVLKFGNLTVENQAIGLASTFLQNFPALGLGTTEDFSYYDYHPTFLQNLVTQGDIDTEVWSFWANDFRSENASLSVGGIDEAKFYGNLITFDNELAGLVGRVNVTGAYWIDEFGRNTSLPIRDLTDTDLPQYRPYEGIGRGQIDVESYWLRVPSSTYSALDAILEPFGLGHVDGTYELRGIPCEKGLPKGGIQLSLEGHIITISYEHLFDSTREYSGQKCYNYFMVDVIPDEEDPITGLQLPKFELGIPFFTNTYLAFDYTNNQTSIAQAVLNTTESKEKAVGQGGAPVRGVGLPIEEFPYFYTSQPGSSTIQWDRPTSTAETVPTSIVDLNGQPSFTRAASSTIQVSRPTGTPDTVPTSTGDRNGSGAGQTSAAGPSMIFGWSMLITMTFFCCLII